MPKVNLLQAKKHLRPWVTAAQAGETTAITRHSRPVAKLVPVEDELAYLSWSAALLRSLDEGPGDGPQFEIDLSDLLPMPGGCSEPPGPALAGHEWGQSAQNCRFNGRKFRPG